MGRRSTSLRWFQVITLINPMTYVSEGMRAALTDGAAPGARAGSRSGSSVATAAFAALGLKGFLRRAVD